MSLAIVAVLSVASMHKEMHERTGQQQQIWKDAEQMSPMFGKQEEADDGQEHQQHNASARTSPTAICCYVFVIHNTS
jgi:hypothetical protein